MDSSDLLHFVDVPVIQSNVSASLGAVLGDIESRMPKGHQYSAQDKVTWAHETTHGINNSVRNANRKSSSRINAFYVLDGKALILDEPPVKISDIANNIPVVLRGDNTYNLYVIKQQKDWNDIPLYLFDEASAYTNGALTRTDLKISGFNSETQFMWELLVYSSYVAIKAGLPKINACLYYFLNRASITTYSSSNIQNVNDYLAKVKSTNDLMQFWKSIGFRFLDNV